MKILISPGYGAGWSTWNSGEIAKYMRTYKPIITAIENGEKMSETHPLVKQLQKECKKKFGKEGVYVCVLGAEDLKVAEAEPPFMINEYDGSESIITPGDSSN